MKKENFKLNGGFTLLETLVAITILLVAVVGPMSVIGGSLAQISTARDQAIAVNLAQEGVEIMRQKRDSNMISCWGSFTSPCGTWDSGLANGDYIIDPTAANPLVLCSSCAPSQKLVRQEVASGWYYQAISGSGGTATKFSRTVSIVGIGSGKEKGITSTVTWMAGGTLKTIKAQESIFGINS